MLSYWQRKEALPHGAIRRVAERMELREDKASRVLLGKDTDRDVQVELAKEMRTPKGARITVSEAFGRPARVRHRKGRATKSVA